MKPAKSTTIMGTSKFLILVCLCIVLFEHCSGIPRNCEKKEKCSLSLEIAENLITRVQDIFPNCTGTVTNSSECGTKDKSSAYLDMAKKLISEVKAKCSTCIGNETKDPNIKEPDPTPEEVTATTRPEGTITDATGTDTPVTDTTVPEGTITDATATEGIITDATATEGTITDETVTEKLVTDTTGTETTKIETILTDTTVTKTILTNSTVTDTTVTKTILTDSTVTETTVAATTETEKPLRSRDCTEVLRNGHGESGVYTIWPDWPLRQDKSLDVYCDMQTDGGGWMVIQRRGNFTPQEIFFRDWTQYKNGFGRITKDFWIGNDNLFALTNQAKYRARFDLEGASGDKAHALYETFWIEDERAKYRLHIDGYSGDASDCMRANNNQYFTTKDRDNDRARSGNCALLRIGAWWYNDCGCSNPNGMFKPGVEDVYSMSWFDWKKKFVGLAAIEIKLKRN